MICFKEFSALSPVELELVFAWRNDERIRKHFINESVGYDEHFAFAKSLKDDENKRYFLVFDDEKPIGVINFVSISKDECEFGIYQNPNLRGFGRILLSNLAHYAFRNLRVKRLVARALKDNEKAIRLFLGFGFTLTSQDERVVHFMMSAPAFSQMTGEGREGGGVIILLCLNIRQFIFTLLLTHYAFRYYFFYTKFSQRIHYE